MGCARCGAEIEKPKPGQKFCKPVCRAAAWRAEHPPRRRAARRRPLMRLTHDERRTAAELASWFI